MNWISKKINDVGFATANNIREGPDIVVPKLNCAIEIETGSSDVYYNISQNVTKYHAVVVASDQKKLLESLKQENKHSNVLFLPIQNVPAFFGKMKGRKNCSVL